MAFSNRPGRLHNRGDPTMTGAPPTVDQFMLATRLPYVYDA